MRTVLMYRSIIGSSTTILLAAGLLAGQVQQQGAASGRLTPADPRGTAISEYLIALDDYQSWSWTDGFAHVQRALAIDSSFGLARALYARYRGGPTVSAEAARAASDAVHATTPEAVIALANYTTGPASEGLWDLAVKLLPNDPRVALDRALTMTGRQRIDALREVANKFPDAAAPRMWLAYWLTNPLFPPRPKADDDEALAAAQAAVRLAPNSTGAHAALAYVYERIGKDEDAFVHLGHATSMPLPSEAAFQIRAELLERRGKYAEARAALDSAILLSDNLSNRVTYMSYRAVSFLYDGNLAATIAGLEDAAREAHDHDQRAAESTVHGTMAIVYAGAGNAKAAEEQRALSRRLGATPGALADGGVIIYALTNQGAAARQVLASYVELVAGAPADIRSENVHRMTGLTLLAEGKAAEAISELKQGGLNPYSQLGLIEAYKQLGRKREADAEVAAMLARKDFGIGSTAMPIVKYRSLKK